MNTIRVVFVSNFLNHHVLPLCNSFIKTPGVIFHFVSTTKTPIEQLNLGYDEMNDKYSFVIKYYEQKQERKHAEKIIKEADIVILDGVWHHFSKLNKRALRFRISERFLKGKCTFTKKLLKRIKYFVNTFGERKNTILLSCGKFSAQDFRFFYRTILKFGYFPPFEKYIVRNLVKEKEQSSFIWAGRFIDWKHPEYVVFAARDLIKKFPNLHFYMIGDGPLLSDVKTMIQRFNLSHVVSLLGPKNHKEVRKIMKKCQFHLLTSDSNEGWGAVLNESMNSACIPISRRTIGSTSYLISDWQNGIIFDDYNDFVSSISEVLSCDASTIFCLQQAAYDEIAHLWNSDVCVERILSFQRKKTLDENCASAGPLSIYEKE